RFSRIRGLVNTVARLDVAAYTGFPHADEDDVRVGFGHGQCTNRRAVDLSVGYRDPSCSAVSGLPESSAGRAEVAFARPTLDARDRQRSSTSQRTNAAP